MKSEVLVVAALLFACCIGVGGLPEDFEEYESEYGFSIELPKGWVIREQKMPSPGEILLECYPSDHSKNPGIELHIWNSGIKNLDDFVKDLYDGKMPRGISDRRIADRAGKKLISQDDKNEHTLFYFQTRSERDGRDMRYYYGQMSFSMELSSFDDAEWNRFVERVAGSLEFKD